MDSHTSIIIKSNNYHLSAFPPPSVKRDERK